MDNRRGSSLSDTDLATWPDSNLPAILDRIGLGDPEVQQTFDRLCRLAARFLNARQALVTLHLPDRHLVLGEAGLEEPWSEYRALPLDHSFCHFVAHNDGLLRVENAEEDDRIDAPAAKTRGIVAYLGLSLLADDDLVGTFCVWDDRPREWCDEEVEALRGLGESVQSAIQLRLDLDRRRRDEARLREQADLLGLVHDVVIVRSLEDRIIFWNRGAADVFGWKAREVNGKKSHEVLATRFPEPLDDIRRKLERDGQWEGDLRCTTRDGRERVLASRWALHRDHSGEVSTILEISRDITRRHQMEEELQAANAQLEMEVADRTTELRRSEARFRALIEHSSEIITILGPDGLVRYSSPSIERILGYKPETRVGKGALDDVHPDDRPNVLEALHQATSGRKPSVVVEYRYRHADGRWRTLQSVALNLIEEPAVGGVVVNTRDVSELREGKHRLERAQRLEAIGRLAGGIAHDFNNVLSIITSIAQLLLLDLAEDNPIRRELREIDKAANRGASLTRQLLAFSRRQVLQPKEVDLNEVFLGVETLLRRSLGAEIEFTSTLAENLEEIIADPAQLEQILLNLAVNAGDAMPGGGSLEISTEMVDLKRPLVAADGDVLQPGRYAVLGVEDSGIGMSPETVTQIFEPFFTTKGAGKGTGLGLSTVYGIVKQSGGNIAVRSQLGSGTTFRIFFPTGQAACELPPAVEPLPAERKTGTVVLLEPDPELRDLAERALQGEGYDTVPVSNVRQAARAIGGRKTRRKLLVMAESSLRTAGLDEIGELIEARAATHLLVTSSDPGGILPGRSELTGNAPILMRPYSSQALLEKVQAAWDTVPTTEAEDSDVHRRATGRILLIDDEAEILDRLSDFLGRLGHDVATASSAAEALSKLRSDPWDLVVTDLRLPDGSGLGVLERVREDWPTTRTILISGHADASDAAAAIERGIDRLFLKPIRFDELRVAIEKILAERRARIRAAQVGRQLQDALRERQRESRLWLLRSAHALVAAVEAKDTYTAGHASRVTSYAVRIAEEVRREIDIPGFKLAGDLHDVGKIGVPDAVLNKPDGLSAEEFEYIRRHPIDGERILQPLIDDPMVLAVVRSHHERWDGKGYPDQLAGEDIPFTARILAIADTLDAMTSTRAYRSPLDFDVTMAEIRRCAGSQFDPALVEIASRIAPDLSALHRSFSQNGSGQN